MIKISENSRNLARFLMEISPHLLPKSKLDFFDESGGTGIEFSKLSFDLMMFTGSPGTAKPAMAAADQNLTPVI